MKSQFFDRRLVWLLCGVAAGVCFSYFWPHEPALADTTSRDDQFLMATVTTSALGSAAEAVFVLDSLTGRLFGAAINARIGRFTNFWLRNVAADFNVVVKAKPRYAMLSGLAYLPSGGGVQPATSCLYVGELTTGKVVAYSFPFKISNVPLTGTLNPVDVFSFREAMRE